MDQPLGVRLAGEALGTFLFFSLGFSGIARRTSGWTRSGRSASRQASASGLAPPSPPSATSRAGTSNPAVSAGPRSRASPEP